MAQQLSAGAPRWALAALLCTAGALVAVFVLTAFAVGAQSSVYSSRAGLAVGVMSGVLTLIFPVMALVPGALLWSADVSGRILVSVHSRANLWPFLVSAMVRRAGLTAGFVFATHLMVFLGGFYLLSKCGVIRYVPEFNTRGSDVDYLADAGPFGFLALVHPLLWGVGQSAWHALWAALFTLLVCLLSLRIANLLLALSAPVLVYFTASLVLGALPPWHVVLATVVFAHIHRSPPLMYYMVPLALMVIVLLVLSRSARAHLAGSPLLR